MQIAASFLQSTTREENKNQKQKYIYIKRTYIITICMHTHADTHIVYRVSIVKFENRK